MQTLGVAVIGTGWVSNEHIKAYLRNPHTEVVAILGRERARAEAQARAYGLDNCRAYDNLGDLLRDDAVQAVSVCTPNDLHAEQAIACAESGRHILLEKPMALTMSDARAIEAAVRRAGVRSLVGFVLRWNPLFQNIKAMLADGLLGPLYLAEVDYLSTIDPPDEGIGWMHRRESAGTNLLMAGCHAVDAVRWFVGGNVTEVFAHANTSPSNRLGFEYRANSITLMKFADGTIGKTSCSLESSAPYRFPITLMGERGAIHNDRVFTSRWPGQTDWATIPTAVPDTAEVTHHPFGGEIDHFVDCILAGRESHCSVADAVRTHEICFASEISANEGRPVRLPLD